MPRTQKVPQTTQMVKNNILEIHQYGETDTPQNNQQRYIDEERIVPRHHQRITQISGQRGESRIAESGNGMKSGKGQLFLKVHPHRPVDVSPDSKHPYSFNHQRKGQNIDQGGEQGIQGIGTHHVAHHQLIVQRGITHEEHGKEARQCHHSQTAYLNQQNDYHKPVGVKVDATSTDVSPVTHTALVDMNSESTHDMPFTVQRGNINSPVPIIMIIKKLAARISEGFVRRPSNRTSRWKG